MRSRAVPFVVAWQLCVLASAGCAGSKPVPGGPDPTTLYARLGGLEAISAVVTVFLQNIAADDRINLRFATADIPDLRQKLIDQICQATGGPCHYQGKDMKAAHAGMNISGPEFSALVEDLTKALDKFQVPPREQHELLTALGSMRGDIVSTDG
jgi:hemoglobin